MCATFKRSFAETHQPIDMRVDQTSDRNIIEKLLDRNKLVLAHKLTTAAGVGWGWGTRVEGIGAGKEGPFGKGHWDLYGKIPVSDMSGGDGSVHR